MENIISLKQRQITELKSAEQIVKNTIERERLIRPGDILLLGLSGGPDSLCLLNILASFKETFSFSLYALHVNHKIRGSEADGDMHFAVEFCKKLNVPVTVKIADIPALAKKMGIGEEECGRIIRQKALKERAGQLASENPGSEVKVVLAHNRDDQAETVLMRILRGTGTHGLSAMEYERDDGLIRPLLDTPRSAIEEYIEKLGLTPRIDSTNSSTDYTRNRIRLQLIPLLEKEFNPNLKESLARLAQSAREDDEALNSIAKKAMPKISNRSTFGNENSWDGISKKELNNASNAVAKRLIINMFARAGLKKDISGVHIQSLMNILSRDGTGVAEFPAGYFAEVTQTMVYFRGPGSVPSVNTEKPKKVKLESLVIPIEKLSDLRKLPKNACALDAVKVSELDCDLEVRTRQPGDRIRPLGMTGSKKLNDYFSDKKIDISKRDTINLLCCRHEVLWVEGYTVSENCKIDGITEYVLLIKLQED